MISSIKQSKRGLRGVLVFDFDGELTTVFIEKEV
jgi:hypothetical protein